MLDSINPCAIAVIIFLISTLLLGKNKKSILNYGIIYIITIFVVYMSLGLGFIYIIKSINIPDLFFLIFGGLLIAIGLLSIKDFFWYGKGISLGIPLKVKKIIESNINKATILSVIFIGFLISLFETACS